MDINYNIILDNKQFFTQTQIQSLEILSLDNCELDAFLQNEYLENPLLDYNSSKVLPDSKDEFYKSYEKNQSVSYEGNFASEDNNQRKEIVAIDNNEIKDYIKSQLNYNNYSRNEWITIEFLLECIDDNGFFTTPIDEVAKLVGMKVEIVEKCLLDLQQLEPYGIFSVDLPHCLCRQLEVIGIENEEIKQMVMYHLTDISEGKISRISRALGLSSLQVRKYIAVIMKLNPRPLAGFQDQKISYIVPDIIFAYQDREWKIALNDNWLGNYSLNEYYLKMMNETVDKELFEYFKNKLERVRFILNSIEQRRKTLLAISETVVNLQHNYFLGKEEAKPMTMNEVAKRNKIHVSTVSRAIKGKYIQYPQGSILLKSLFVAAVSNNSNEEGNTAAHIKTIIKKLIEQEDKKNPYSDQTLMLLLKEREIIVSRRVIAKYREALGIKGSFDRKDI